MTAEVARDRASDVGSFRWRVSIATVEGNAEFSLFDGVDRLLLPLGPAALDLSVDEQPVRLRPHGVHAFRGESRDLAGDAPRGSQAMEWKDAPLGRLDSIVVDAGSELRLAGRALCAVAVIHQLGALHIDVGDDPVQPAR